jgi:tetratricopeptide (TPR) repeat protein
MARDGTEVRLGPLSEADAATLMARVAGRPPKGPIGPLLARTEGNPLFVVEFARAIRQTTGGTTSWQSMPPTLRELVLERIAPVPPDARAALEAGAVLGRDFSSGRVARLLHRLPAQVIDSLRVAVDLGVVSETKPGHFSFTHIVVRDAVAEATPALRTVDLHAGAEAILADEGDGVDVIVERARHALASMVDGAAARDLAWRAVRLLEGEGAFDRALAMVSHIEESRARGEVPPESSEEKLHRARLLQQAGRFAEAEALCDRLAAEARASGDAELLARAALAKGAELRPAIVSPGLVSILRASLAMPPGDAGTACLLRARLAAALQPADDPMGPVALAREAIATARTLGEGRLLVDVLNWAGAALVDYAPLDERVRLNEELFDRAVREGEPVLALRAQMRLALDYLELGELPAWTHALERLRSLSSELGHPRHRCRPLLVASMACVARGDVLGSERALVEIRELSGLSDDPALALALEAHIGQVARLLHRDEEAPQAIARMESMPEPTSSATAFVSMLILGIVAQLEDDAELRQRGIDTEPGARRLEAMVGEIEPEPGVATGMLALALSRVGTLEACRRTRARLVAAGKRHIVSGHIPMTYEGPVARFVALLDARLGDIASAERWLRDALAEARAHGLRPWVAMMEYDLGCVLAAADRSAEAETLLDSAGRAAAEIGMPGLVARAASRRRQAPIPVGPTRAASFDMTRQGDAWRLRFGERTFLVKDSRGMQLLARLVERPGEEMHVLALGSDEAGKSLVEGPGGSVIDARTRGEYKTRLVDLSAEIDEADAMGDLARVDRLRREKALLEAELLAAMGIGGKGRSAGSASERARVNVQRRLKDAVGRIGELDPAAGAYLEKAVRTGTYCRFGL